MSEMMNRKALLPILLTAVITALAVVAAAQFMAKEHSAQKVVFRTSGKLLAASTKQIMDMKLDKDQSATISAGLAGNMKTLVQEYRTQGFVVLNSSAALTYPEELDITASFAERLGVKLE